MTLQIFHNSSPDGDFLSTSSFYHEINHTFPIARMSSYTDCDLNSEAKTNIINGIIAVLGPGAEIKSYHEYFTDTVNHNIKIHFVSHYDRKRAGHNYVTTTLYILGRDDVTLIVQSGDTDLAKEILTKLNECVIPYKRKEEPGGSYINFICRNADGFYTNSYEVSNGLNFDTIYDNYEENFKEGFSDIIIDKLSNKEYNKGIVLLHGEPGTGKTTYLRYLFSRIKDKQIMYLAPDMAHHISDPAFVTFLMDNPNSILVIEDAENVIMSRDIGHNQAVSNILNVTDGILGSALKYQIICTFNAKFAEIDVALKRKGRMIGEYEFKALSPERTRYLVKKLYGEDIEPIKPSMTIADIHEMTSVVPTTDKVERSIGFI